jgi:hypothetical protein
MRGTAALSVGGTVTIARLIAVPWAVAIFISPGSTKGPKRA